MRRTLLNLKKQLFVFPIVLTLLGCEQQSFNNFAKNTETSIKQLFRNIKEYNYSEFWYNIKTSFKITNRSRYFEKQLIKVETLRNTQISAYENILKECIPLGCKIIKEDLNKNLMFPENIIGKITLELPTTTAPQLLSIISKYGNIVKNQYEKDDWIEKDIQGFQNEIIPLQQALIQTNENLTKTEVYNLERLKTMQEYAISLNKKILFIEDDIRYLNSLKDKRYIEITIERGYNSTQSLVKAKLQNFFASISKYLHIFVIILGIYLTILLYKFIKHFTLTTINNIKQNIKKKKSQKKEQEPEFKIPPQF